MLDVFEEAPVLQLFEFWNQVSQNDFPDGHAGSRQRRGDRFNGVLISPRLDRGVDLVVLLRPDVVRPFAPLRCPNDGAQRGPLSVVDDRECDPAGVAEPDAVGFAGRIGPLRCIGDRAISVALQLDSIGTVFDDRFGGHVQCTVEHRRPVGFALFGALLYALTLAPGLTYLALKKPTEIRPNRFIEFLRRGYRDALTKLLTHIKVAYACAAAALVLVLILGASVGREFLPDLDEGALWMQVQMPTGLSLDKASEMAAELRRTVRSFPEVSYIVTQTGRNDSGTDPWTPSHIESAVGLTPYNTWPDHESKARFVQRLSDRLAQIPGMQVGISQPIVDGVNDMVGGAHSPLVLRIYGGDFQELRRIGGEIVGVLRQTPGTGEASIFQEPPIPQIVIEADREAAARYGINVADIMNLVQNAVGGAPITQIYNADETHNITIHLPPEVASSPERLGALVLTSSSGAPIPLNLVAHIRLQTGESTISHEEGLRQITIRIDNRGRALSQYLADAQQRIDSQVRFDRAAYHMEWAGQFENEQRAQARLSVVMSLVVLVMGALLFFQFGAIRHALLILGVVPLAALGGLVALHLRGETLNIATAVGFIALFGVAVQNGIIMISNIRRVRARHDTLGEAVIAGAAERFRPVLLTATVASVGMLPAALATGVGTDVQRGLATVVVGGLAIATLLTLFILPAFYFAMESWFEARARPDDAHEEHDH